MHNNLKGARILLNCFIENKKRPRTLTIKLLRNMQRKMTNFFRSAFNDFCWRRRKTMRPFEQENVITYCCLWFPKPNCFQNCIRVIKKQTQSFTKSNQNVTITVSRIIIPSLLGLMMDSHSSLKLNIEHYVLQNFLQFKLTALTQNRTQI